MSPASRSQASSSRSIITMKPFAGSIAPWTNTPGIPSPPIASFARFIQIAGFRCCCEEWESIPLKWWVAKLRNESAQLLRGAESPPRPMSLGTEQRKLAAIMFTDMVGYSALSQRDDKVALELLEEHGQLLREIFPRFNGTEIKTIGDAFLIEFNSALEAAQCAIEIQRTLAKRNHDVTAERRIELRIGIHIDDVVHRGG